MQGNYDRLLKWPLKAEMKLVLLNQQQQGDNREFNIGLNYGKPLLDGTSSVECGNVVIGASLGPYLRDGDVRIRIVSIEF